jgi:hypothetical protein|tara:strand:- start:1051 stop:1233 length:183 start_codon:yes stop_codon:yes gene_type:complete
MSKQLNEVSRKECIDAIEYLFVQGYTEEMTSDKRYYTEILLKKVANDYNIKLEFEEESVG